ncbi:MAG: hypothetical protein HXS44_13140 [Theionarchaea archaeon]|nr:hypothetical protein [Theionarchaea archaeon]
MREDTSSAMGQLNPSLVITVNEKENTPYISILVIMIAMNYCYETPKEFYTQPEMWAHGYP